MDSALSQIANAKTAEQVAEAYQLYIVNVSAGYQHGGAVNPVDSVIEIQPTKAEADVARGFLLPVEGAADNRAFTPAHAALVAAYRERKAKEPPPPAPVVEVKPDPIAEAEASRVSSEKAEALRRAGVTEILSAQLKVPPVTPTVITQQQGATPVLGDTATPVDAHPEPVDQSAKKK